MSKNEYRRAFIMLRPVQPDCSGHVRLERRTMTGSLYFIVTAPGEGYEAALAGQRGGEYYAAPLGSLRRDARGQLTLAYTFDPRSIAGRPLEAYQLLVVARKGDACQVALTGNVDGAYPMDFGAVRQAVCALYAPRPMAADVVDNSDSLPPIPEPEPEPEPTPEPEPEPTPEPEPVPECPPCPECPECPACPEPECPACPEPECPACPEPECPPSPEPECPPSPKPECPPSPEPECPPSPRPECKPDPRPKPECEPEHAKTRIYTRMRACPVKPSRPAATPCRMPLEDGYHYIHMPLPEVSGLEYCLLGVRIREDRVHSVRCALPGEYAAQPPQGLSGAVWLSPCDGSREGYWVVTVPCEED